MAPEAAFSEVVKDCGGARVPLIPTPAVKLRHLRLRSVDEFARMRPARPLAYQRFQ